MSPLFASENEQWYVLLSFFIDWSTNRKNNTRGDSLTSVLFFLFPPSALFSRETSFLCTLSFGADFGPSKQ